MNERVRGKVKWFSNTRGYGFIEPDTGGSDIFIHFSNVQMEGYRTLRENQSVEFEVGTIEKNGRAMSNALEVTILPDSDPENCDLEDLDGIDDMEEDEDDA